jgi:hypothetical protein
MQKSLGLRGQGLLGLKGQHLLGLKRQHPLLLQISDHLDIGRDESDEAKIAALSSVHAVGDALFVKVPALQLAGLCAYSLNRLLTGCACWQAEGSGTHVEEDEGLPKLASRVRALRVGGGGQRGLTHMLRKTRGCLNWRGSAQLASCVCGRCSQVVEVSDDQGRRGVA